VSMRDSDHPARLGVAILGVTGSIGASALRVLERHADRFRLVAVTANASAQALREIEQQWHPEFVGLVDSRASTSVEWKCGEECLVEAATHPDVDIVLNAVVGAAGLPATLAALKLGRRVALANKETLVVAGAIVMETARLHGGTVLPVDSEHSAILQCVGSRSASEVRRMILTASGGPFRTWSAQQIDTATLSDALQHPTWSMGSKITVDSATLANKALEVIEAHHLFGMPYDALQVVVHPQSIIHSFVEFIDGSMLAQLGVPSMELPVLYALTWPERAADSGVAPFDPVAQQQLTFEAVRHADFPMLELGIAAGRQGGAAPAVFNASNEAAVALFLDGRIGFRGIASTVTEALEELGHAPGTSLRELLDADAAAREFVLTQAKR
jgi:1-deoxy-D-xylulose-5-phosphate reductoisomerase